MRSTTLRLFCEHDPDVLLAAWTTFDGRGALIDPGRGFAEELLHPNAPVSPAPGDVEHLRDPARL